MRSLLISTLLVSAVLTAAQDTTKRTSSASSSNTLSGCLMGHPDQYYIIDNKGHHHTVMAGQDLSSFVNHTVIATGRAGRAPGRSSDTEGHSSGFFRIEKVTDQGYCKKK